MEAQRRFEHSLEATSVLSFITVLTPSGCMLPVAQLLSSTLIWVHGQGSLDLEDDGDGDTHDDEDLEYGQVKAVLDAYAHSPSLKLSEAPQGESVRVVSILG